MSHATREIDGKKIWWMSEDGFTHICEASAHALPDHPRLIWTLCGKDVPANTAHHDPFDFATCDACIAKAGGTE